MMKTWNEETKAHYTALMQAHQNADRLIQGTWWNGEQGCFFGCVTHSSFFDVLPTAAKEMHLPFWLVCLAERVFEGLPKEEALVFPVQLCKAIPCDVDISSVGLHFDADLLTQNFNHFPVGEKEHLAIWSILKDRLFMLLDVIENEKVLSRVR